MIKLRRWLIKILAGEDIVFTNYSFQGLELHFHKDSFLVNPRFYRVPDPSDWSDIIMNRTKTPSTDSEEK